MNVWNIWRHQRAARRAAGRRGLLALTLLCIGAASCPAAADQAHSLCAAGILVRSQDQVWLVSTRHIGCTIDGVEPAFWQWSADRWVASGAKQFHADHESFPHTVIYIHGNRVGDDEGASGGLAVYQEIVGKHAEEKPVRFVIWSWPSSKICGPVKDVRSKAWRSDDEAVLLARFLAGFHKPEAAVKATAASHVDRDSSRALDASRVNERRVGIVAFSYGARITGGALHLLGGGQLDGYTVPSGQRPQFHVAFWAAAAHNDWLLAEHRHGRALPLGQQWLSLINRCDESLWRYERLEKCGNPPALGYVGFTGRGQLSEELQNRWKEWEVSNLVSSTHNYHPYVYSPWIAEQTAKCVLWREP